MNKLKEYLRDRFGYQDDDISLIIDDMRNMKKNPFKIAKKMEIPVDMVYDVLGEL